jgi:hypothetical protein
VMLREREDERHARNYSRAAEASSSQHEIASLQRRVAVERARGDRYKAKATELLSAAERAVDNESRARRAAETATAGRTAAEAARDRSTRRLREDNAELRRELGLAAAEASALRGRVAEAEARAEAAGAAAAAAREEGGARLAAVVEAHTRAMHAEARAQAATAPAASSCVACDELRAREARVSARAQSARSLAEEAVAALRRAEADAQGKERQLRRLRALVKKYEDDVARAWSESNDCQGRCCSCPAAEVRVQSGGRYAKSSVPAPCSVSSPAKLSSMLSELANAAAFQPSAKLAPHVHKEEVVYSANDRGSKEPWGVYAEIQHRNVPSHTHSHAHSHFPTPF